jgi:hypothetical protein
MKKKLLRLYTQNKYIQLIKLTSSVKPIYFSLHSELGILIWYMIDIHVNT